MNIYNRNYLKIIRTHRCNLRIDNWQKCEITPNRSQSNNKFTRITCLRWWYISVLSVRSVQMNKRKNIESNFSKNARECDWISYNTNNDWLSLPRSSDDDDDDDDDGGNTHTLTHSHRSRVEPRATAYDSRNPIQLFSPIHDASQLRCTVPPCCVWLDGNIMWFAWSTHNAWTTWADGW